MDNKTKVTLELGTRPVGKLLAQYALPAIIAMVASSLYNMVDSIFIGQGVGALAIAGLAITFPFMNLTAAFGAAIGVGSSTLISVRLGQKRYADAQQILGNNVTLNILVGIFLCALCFTFLDPLLLFFGASPYTITYAREYMQIILLGNVVTHLYFGMNAVLRAASKPRHAMSATMFTVIMNTILDPIFIYTLDMGIRGAAIATVLSQLMALCWQLRVMSDSRELLHLRRGIYRLRPSLVREILGIGLSPFSINACACLVVIIVNNVLVAHGGDLAVGAYGIGNRLVFIFVMINMGINQGMQPIVGYNYGARQYDRMMLAVRYAILAATVVTTVGWIVCEFFPDTCVRLFTTDVQLREIAVHGLRINAAVLPVIGYQMVIINFFQSIGKARVSIFLSLSRQLLFLVPALLVLPRFMGIDGVWLAMPVSDAVAALVAAWFMVMYMRRFRIEKDAAGEPHFQMTHEEREPFRRSYSYYTSRNGATPRGMAPQASMSQMPDEEEAGTASDTDR
ncbi:MAG: MATE family efflux transporter [Prevotella sp.]